MGSWHQPGTHGTPRQGRRADLVFGKSANPTPEPTKSDPQMLRFCQAGHCYPPRQARTNRALLHGSFLAATGTQWVPGNTEEPSLGSWTKAT
jgi:hypothetical protein